MCPNCGSYNYDSNRIKSVSFERVAQAAQAAHRVNHPAMAFGALALWGGIRAANAMRKAYCCNVCGHKFNA